MACLLPRSCLHAFRPFDGRGARTRDPTRSAKSGSVAPLKPLLTARFFASSVMQLRNTMRPHSTPASEQWKGRQIEYQCEAQRAAMEYGWTGQRSGSGLSDRPRGVLGVFASSDRL
jgi:hypothetical protein